MIPSGAMNCRITSEPRKKGEKGKKVKKGEKGGRKKKKERKKRKKKNDSKVLIIKLSWGCQKQRDWGRGMGVPGRPGDKAQKVQREIDQLQRRRIRKERRKGQGAQARTKKSELEGENIKKPKKRGGGITEKKTVKRDKCLLGNEQTNADRSGNAMGVMGHNETVKTWGIMQWVARPPTTCPTKITRAQIAVALLTGPRFSLVWTALPQ